MHSSAHRLSTSPRCICNRTSFHPHLVPARSPPRSAPLSATRHRHPKTQTSPPPQPQPPPRPSFSFLFSYLLHTLQPHLISSWLLRFPALTPGDHLVTCFPLPLLLVFLDLPFCTSARSTATPLHLTHLAPARTRPAMSARLLPECTPATSFCTARRLHRTTPASP